MMANPITIPDCARKLLEFLYPTVDWNGVMFFSGMPGWASDADALTIPNPLGSCGYRIYLGKNTDFCKLATITTIVHEGFHVQQFTGIAGGCGAGFMRPVFFQYFVCFFAEYLPRLIAYLGGKLVPGGPTSLAQVYNQAYYANPFEQAAYAQQDAFVLCQGVDDDPNNLPNSNPPKIVVCVCTKGEPVFDPAALDSFKVCNENLIVTRPRIPRCGTWWSWLLAFVVVSILAVLAFLFHLFDLLHCKYLEMQSLQCIQWGQSARQQCSDWADQGYSACSEWADQGYQACTEFTDQGYNVCQQTADWGYNACCDWAPCSWFCKLLVWISNIVCVLSVWVANLVCTISVWIANLVCIVTIWIAHLVCILWVTIVEIVCVVWMFVIRTILFCWWR